MDYGGADFRPESCRVCCFALGKTALWRAVVGFFGGLVSSTATTMVYARHSKTNEAMCRLSAVVILIASRVVLVRLAVVSAVVSHRAQQIVAAVGYWSGVRVGGVFVGLCVGSKSSSDCHCQKRRTRPSYIAHLASDSCTPWYYCVPLALRHRRESGGCISSP